MKKVFMVFRIDFNIQRCTRILIGGYTSLLRALITLTTDKSKAQITKHLRLPCIA